MDIVPPLDETAFLVIKRQDGSFYATVNLEEPISLERPATVRDVRVGCRELAELLSNSELAQLIVDKLGQNGTSDSERASSSIRQALQDKGIL